MSKTTSVGWAAALMWFVIAGTQAAIIPVTLDNLRFDDGGTATGFFEFEQRENGTVRLTDFDIATSAGRLPSFRYVPSTVTFSKLNGSGNPPETNGLALAFTEIQTDPTDPTHVLSVRNRGLGLHFEAGLFSGPETFPISQAVGIPSYEFVISETPDIFTRVDRSVVEGAAIRTIVPEPSSLILIAVGAGSLLMLLSIRDLACPYGSQ